MSQPADLERRLRTEIRGDVALDAFTRGRYATDASIYQVMPAGVIYSRDSTDMAAALTIARDMGLSILPRGGGTSQNGQTVNRGLVLDTSVHMNGVLEVDAEGRRCVVEPGVVLDTLNAQLRPLGLWFPVDISTSSRATIGGMAGNNSCGTRSVRYGIMRDNVIGLDALLADGTTARFGVTERIAARRTPLLSDLLDIAAGCADEIRANFPKVQRRVGGYNLDALLPEADPPNFAHLLVGSEGTLGLFTRIELKLWPVIPRRVVGVCHFARFYDAMSAAQRLATLNPLSIELIDRTMIELARDIAAFRPTLDAFVRGDPEALLLVEFAEEDEAAGERRLRELEDVMGDLSFGFNREGRNWGGVVPVVDAGLQAAITEVRQAGLNIVMSMRSAGKPVSFIEDCAVPLEHLADYTDRLTAVFARHGTRGTWYAHASVGCLHVRPVLNLKLDKDVRAMRAIAEEAFALVRAYKGSHSGEHGDGISRSEFHEAMFGRPVVAAFEAVKDRFDPTNLLNPGRIVRPPRMDDRTLFRYGPAYRDQSHRAALAWEGGRHGFLAAVEMCNNNGACRKLAGGVMCPSYRATRNERDTTRGRANTLRLALSGQLGPQALGSDEMAETMALCVSCKACRRECPTGVDMARMKIEVQAARAAAGRLTVRDRVVGHLPRLAPWAARVAPLLNLRDRVPGLAWLSEKLFGFAAARPLPVWTKSYRPEISTIAVGPRTVALFADTFGIYFEPENLRAAKAVLRAAAYDVVEPAGPAADPRPLCCGRTFLSAGLVDEARAELRRVVAAFLPLVERGVTIVGLEPSCLLTLRDELRSLLPGADSEKVAASALLFEEFLAREADAGRLSLPLAPLSGKVYLHGHCHQKSFGAMGSVEKVLRLIPGVAPHLIASSCCGMAGAFGYQAETYDVSVKMGELSLLPAVRKAEPDALIVADGISCRHQIRDGAGRQALHVARVLEQALAAAGPRPAPAGLTGVAAS